MKGLSFVNKLLTGFHNSKNFQVVHTYKLQLNVQFKNVSIERISTFFGKIGLFRKIR